MAALRLGKAYPYYPELLTDYGFRPWREFHGYSLDLGGWAEAVVCHRSSLAIEVQSLADAPGLWERVWQLHNRVAADCSTLEPVAESEARLLPEYVRRFTEQVVLLLARRGNEDVGYSLLVGDVNQGLHSLGGRWWPWGWLLWRWTRRRIDRGHWLACVAAETPQGFGASAALANATLRVAAARGWHSLEVSSVPARPPWERRLQRWGAKQCKRWLLYELEL